MARAIGVDVEGGAAFPCELHLLVELREFVRTGIFGDLVAIEAWRLFVAMFRSRLGIGNEAVVHRIENAAQQTAHPRGPDHRHGVEREFRSDLVHQIEGVLAFAVDLVDEGDDRHVAQPADLEELKRLRLDAFRRIDHHDGAVGGGQRPVGVLAEILVARRIEQVADDALVFEGHHRRRHRDAAVLLDLHPVRTRTPVVAARLHLPGKADRPAFQQQVLGQRRFTGVGVGDDREGPAVPDLRPHLARPGGGFGRTHVKLLRICGGH